MDPKELGARIRRAREEAHLSQQELGKLMNRSHAAISDIERGVTKVSVVELTQIARFLNKPVPYFLGSEPKAVFRRGEAEVSPEHSRELRSSIEDFKRYSRLLAEKKRTGK